MILTVKDRIVIETLFHRESDKLSKMIEKDIVRKTELSIEERKQIELRANPNGGMAWSGEIDKDVDFSEAELNHLKKLARDADAGRKVTQDNLDLIDKVENAKFGEPGKGVVEAELVDKDK